MEGGEGGEVEREGQRGRKAGSRARERERGEQRGGQSEQKLDVMFI